MIKMDLRDVLLHPVQLKKVVINKLGIINNSFYEGTEVETSTQFGGRGEVIDSTHGYTYLNLKTVATSNNETIYEIEIEFKGKCELDEAEEVSIEDFGQFLEFQCISLLWPYVRENLPTLMIKMGVEPIEIPTIHVLKTLLNQEI